MIIDELNPKVIDIFIRESYLTKRQLEILLDFYQRKILSKAIQNRRGKVRLNDKVISRGTYYRILSQARRNIIKAIITIIIVTSLNIVSRHDITTLINRINIIDIEEEIAREIINLLNEIFKFK